MATRMDIELRMPRIIFFDGCLATVYRKGIPQGTPEKVKMILLPHAPSIRAADIENDMTRLNEPSPILGVHRNMVYEQWYPSNALVLLTINPEWTIWLGFCSIKGEPLNIGSPMFNEINKIIRRANSFENQVKELESELQRLRERNRKLVLSTTKSIREEAGLSKEESYRRVLPHEMIGMEFGRKEEQK